MQLNEALEKTEKQKTKIHLSACASSVNLCAFLMLELFVFEYTSSPYFIFFPLFISISLYHVFLHLR